MTLVEAKKKAEVSKFEYAAAVHHPTRQDAAYWLRQFGLDTLRVLDFEALRALPKPEGN